MVMAYSEQKCIINGEKWVFKGEMMKTTTKNNSLKKKLDF